MATVGNSGWNDMIPEQKHYKDITIFGPDAMNKMLTEYSFSNLLEIGPGDGTHNKLIKESYHGDITTIDIVDDIFVPDIKADYQEHIFEKKFDAIWCSHVLEHVMNPFEFLKKLYNDLEDGGYLFLTVPPLKHNIVVGHYSLWNAALLLIHLIHAGFDCRSARVGTYGYNVSVIIQKDSSITIDRDDVYKYLPPKIVLNDYKHFDGRILNIEWDDTED